MSGSSRFPMVAASRWRCSHAAALTARTPRVVLWGALVGLLLVAQSLLVLAFLAESIQEIADEAIAEDIRAGLETWLARHED